MKSTKTEKIKNVLLSGAVVTSMSAFRMGYITRLSSIIHELRGQGLPIVTGTPDSAFTEGLISECARKSMMCDYDSSRFAVYYIKPNDLKNIKNAG